MEEASSILNCLNSSLSQEYFMLVSSLSLFALHVFLYCWKIYKSNKHFLVMFWCWISCYYLVSFHINTISCHYNLIVIYHLPHQTWCPFLISSKSGKWQKQFNLLSSFFHFNLSLLLLDLWRTHLHVAAFPIFPYWCYCPKYFTISSLVAIHQSDKTRVFGSLNNCTSKQRS